MDRMVKDKILPDKIKNIIKLADGVFSLIKGTRAPRYKYPWFASVLVDVGTDPVRCGGTILDDRHVLTSILCTGPTPVMSVTVGRYSDRRPANYEQTLTVRRKFEHPDYNSTTMANDIVILRTSRIKFNRGVMPVKRSDKIFDRLPGMNCWLTGFGVTGQETGEVPDILQELPTMVLERSRCRKMGESVFGWGDRMTTETVCTRNVYDGPCMGDQGGPVGCYDTNGDYKLLGILSWGNVIYRKCYHGFNVYTRVSQYRAWIDNIIN